MGADSLHRDYHKKLEELYLDCLGKIQSLPKNLSSDKNYYTRQLFDIFGKNKDNGFEAWLYKGLNSALNNSVEWYAMQLYSPFRYKSRLLNLSNYGENNQYSKKIKKWYYEELDKGEYSSIIGLYQIAFDPPAEDNSGDWTPKSFTLHFADNESNFILKDNYFEIPRYKFSREIKEDILNSLPGENKLDAIIRNHRNKYQKQLDPLFIQNLQNSLSVFFNKPELKMAGQGQILGLLIFLQALSPSVTHLNYRTSIVRKGTVGLPLLVATSNELNYWEILSIQRTIDFISNAIISFDIESNAESEATELESTQWAHVINARLDLLSGLSRAAVNQFSDKMGITLINKLGAIESACIPAIQNQQALRPIRDNINFIRALIENASVKNLEILTNELDQMRLYNYGLQEMGALQSIKIQNDYCGKIQDSKNYTPDRKNFLADTFVPAAKHAICRMLLNDEMAYNGARKMLVKSDYLIPNNQNNDDVLIVNPRFYDSIFFKEDTSEGCPKSILKVREYQELWHFVRHYFQEGVFELPAPKEKNIPGIIKAAQFPAKEYSYIYIAVIEELFYNAMKAIGNRVHEALIKQEIDSYKIGVDFHVPLGYDLISLEFSNTVNKSFNLEKDVWENSRQGIKIVYDRVIRKIADSFEPNLPFGKDKFVQCSNNVIKFTVPVRVNFS